MALFSKRHFQQPNLRRRRILLPLLSFCIPFLVIIVALAGMQITPFGDHTLLISDGKAYYINTLSYAGRMFRGLEGLTYSFEKGLGGCMSGHLNGILLTPFSFLFSFVGVERYPVMYTFVSTLNLSLSGLTMYLLLADIYGHESSNLIFSTSYALMGFNVANVFQAVFFCAAPVLPIMFLGLRRILQGRNPLTYILSITYGLCTNAYFGFVLCVASLLFFLAGLYLYYEELKGRMKRITLNYAISSLCGGLLATLLWLPSFLSLRGGRLDQDSSGAISMLENMPLLDMGSKLFTGANSTDELVNGLPNIYIGIIPLALSVLFFMNHKIDGRKKTALAALLGVYLAAFYLSVANWLMHAGTTTNWFNYRYSYVLSFLLLVAAAESWNELDGVTGLDIQKCFIGMLVATMLIFSKRFAYVKGGWVLVDFALLVLAGLALHMHRNDSDKNPRKTLEQILLFLVCTNLFLNYRVCTLNIQDWEIKESEFQETVLAVNPLVKGLSANEDAFFRMEVNEQLSGTCGNDPMLYGYNGVGHGGSNERDFVRVALSRLGVPWYSNRSYYADGIPAATDALLGIKYVLATDDLTAEKGYPNVTNFGDQPIFASSKYYDIYYNQDALSLAMLANPDIFSVETDASDVFQNLNKVWASVTGEDKPVFVEENEITFIPHSFTNPTPMNSKEARETVESYDKQASTSSDSEKLSTREGPTDPNERPQFSSYIEYTFTAACDGYVYAYNRVALTDEQGSVEPAISGLGYHKAGETVTGYITTDSLDQVVMEEYCGRFRVAYADTDALHKLSELVKSRPVTTDVPSDDHLIGSFTAQKDQALLLTIPFDEGWTCWIDGKEAKLETVFGVLMAVKVPAGTHNFEMRYVPAGLRIGLIISGIALIATVLYLAIGRSKKLFGGTAAVGVHDGTLTETLDEAKSAVSVSESTESGVDINDTV